MRHDNLLTESGAQYAEAYMAHYTRRDLPAALGLYRKVITEYPDTQEAVNSRMQLRNIVNASVPEEEILEAEMDMALAHLEPASRV